MEQFDVESGTIPQSSHINNNWFFKQRQLAGRSHLKQQYVSLLEIPQQTLHLDVR